MSVGCVDCDGVLHAGGYAPITLEDPPVAGAVEFLNEAGRGWDIVVLTARPPEDWPAVLMWLHAHGLDVPVRVTNVKPPADWYLDDRALLFRGPGTFPTLATLEAFQPWWEGAARAVSAQDLYDRAEAEAPHVTADVQGAVTAAGGYLAELDHRLKPVSSLEGKLVRYEGTGKSVIDALRFTAIFPTTTYRADVTEALRRLTAAGYTVQRSRDYWTTGDGTYVGINDVLRCPDGYDFELQFHTPESLQVNSAQDRLYRQLRDGGLDPAVEALVRESMRRGLQSVPRPS